MKKRNLVLCLASLCGVGAFAAGYLLLNNDAKIIHSVENDYTVKLISTDFKDNGKIVANAADSGYQLNLDYGHGETNADGYVSLYNGGYISNTGFGSSIINGIKSIKIASDDASLLSLYCGNNPSVLKKATLDSNGLATFDSEVAYFKITSKPNAIYYIEITYTCNRNELGDYVVSGDSVSDVSLSVETVAAIEWKSRYFVSNQGSLKISDHVPTLDTDVFATSGEDTYLLDYKKAIAQNNNNVINWSNENDTYELNLPSALEVIKVNVDGKEVTSYEVSDSKISLTYKNASMNRVDVFASDNNVYRFYISKSSSEKRDESYLTKNNIEYVKITDVEQFKSIFKLDGSTLSSEDKDNLSKNYLLDCDIDLGGIDIDPIGFEKTNPDGLNPFWASFYGNGHTIKNFNLSKTESARSGFFATLNGNVYDLNLASFTNNSTNWSVGGLAGLIGEGGQTPVISNVNIVDATIQKGDDKAEFDIKTGQVGAITGYNVKSSIQNCTYNGYVGGLTK